MKVIFKEGDDVAFKNNIALKMTVKEIVYRNISVPIKLKSDGTGFDRGEKKVLDGIVCFWMKGSDVSEYKFRSDTLVPWDVATKGISAVADYIKDIQEERVKEG